MKWAEKIREIALGVRRAGEAADIAAMGRWNDTCHELRLEATSLSEAFSDEFDADTTILASDCLIALDELLAAHAALGDDERTWPRFRDALKRAREAQAALEIHTSKAGYV